MVGISDSFSKVPVSASLTIDAVHLQDHAQWFSLVFPGTTCAPAPVVKIGVWELIGVLKSS